MYAARNSGPTREKTHITSAFCSFACFMASNQTNGFVEKIGALYKTPNGRWSLTYSQ